MTEPDRALRALTQKILAEAKPLIDMWERSGACPQSASAEKLVRDFEPIMARYLPRLPDSLPPFNEIQSTLAAHVRKDVFKDPSLLDGVSPTLDAVILLLSLTEYYHEVGPLGESFRHIDQHYVELIEACC